MGKIRKAVAYYFWCFVASVMFLLLASIINIIFSHIGQWNWADSTAVFIMFAFGFSTLISTLTGAVTILISTDKKERD